MTRIPAAADGRLEPAGAADVPVAARGLGAAQNAALFVARLGLASLFLFSGAEKLTGLHGAVGWAASQGVPLAPLVMPLAALFEIGAGLMLVTGWRARTAAAALAAWIAVLGPIFHQFWNAPPEAWQVSIDDFFHHWVMFGGMVYVVIFGPGRWTLPRRGG
jgi:putative oxidoreductase